jgi:hypothetical protein
MSQWHRDASMRYLNENPLPTEFRWPHRDGGERSVWPSHTMVHGYGKWLRETPYFPGLFELAHDILDQEDDLGNGTWLADLLNELRARHDLTPEPGRESLAHRLRPHVWTKDQIELPITEEDRA